MRRVIAGVLVAVSMFSCGWGVNTAYGEPIEAIREALDQSLARERVLLDVIENIDGEIEKADLELKEAERLYKEKEKELFQAHKELKDAEKAYSERAALFGKRLERMYKLSGVEYIDLLMSSKGLDEFFTRYDMVKAIVQKDKETIESLHREKEELAKRKDSLLLGAKEKARLRGDVRRRKKAIERERVEREVKLREVERDKGVLADAFATESERQDRIRQEELALMTAVSLEASLGGEREVGGNQDLLGGTVSPISGDAKTLAERVVRDAYKYLGIPYVWGGATPRGFDCSGLVQYIYRDIGIRTPRVARDQQNFGQTVSLSEIAPGDLVFWGRPAHHVGIYIGGDKYIHAPQTGDVVRVATLSKTPPTSIKRFIKSEPINIDKDL